MRPAVLLLITVCVTPGCFAAKLSKKKHKHKSSTSTSTTTTTTTTTELPTVVPNAGDDGNNQLPYFEDMEIIKIHVPLPFKERPTKHDSGADVDGLASTTVAADVTPAFTPTSLPFTEYPSLLTTTEVQFPEQPTAAAEDRVVIPDIATFDAVFANRSRLADDIRIFTFGGVYEIVVNRTRNSVEIIMVKKNDSVSGEQQVELSEVFSQMEMMVRGPSITGLENLTPNVDDRSGAGFANKGKYAPSGKNVDEDEKVKESDDNNPNKDDSRDYKRDQSNKDKAANSKPVKPQDSRHSEDQAQDKFNAIFINGSALNGFHIGVMSFNSSGIFKLDVSVGKDFTTIIIAKISKQLKEHGVPAPRNVAPIGTQARLLQTTPIAAQVGAGSLTTLLTLTLLAAMLTLLAAVLVWRRRQRQRLETGGFLRRGEDYGSVEQADAAVDFYQQY